MTVATDSTTGSPDGSFLIRPADAVLVSRRRTWRSAFGGFRSGVRQGFADLVSWVVSVRIQVATNSEWNHIAIFVGGDEIIEAQWNGVVRGSFDHYARNHVKYRVATVEFPGDVPNRFAAVHAAAREVTTKPNEPRTTERGTQPTSYDWRWVVLIKVSTILFGPEGTRRLRAKKDAEWICSELVEHAWIEAGAVDKDACLTSPGDFHTFASQGRAAFHAYPETAPEP